MMATPIQDYSDIDRAKFQSIAPSQFFTFVCENTLEHPQLLPSPILRFAVCDNPLANPQDDNHLIAAMIVPKDQEHDWSYCTESGHMQLLFETRKVSRLFLIGNLPMYPEPEFYKRPPHTDTLALEKVLKQGLKDLHRGSFGFLEPIIARDKDNVAYSVTIARYVGAIVGDFLIEDVEDVEPVCDDARKLLRCLRFKRSPREVQSQAVLVPVIGDDEGTIHTDLESLRKIANIHFEVDTTVLVNKRFNLMVSGLFLIASHLNGRIQQGLTPRALCLGIGGGVLLNFLETQLGFDVTGVDSDHMVLTAATEHFGFNRSGTIRAIVGDAIECILNFPPRKPKGDTDESMMDKDVQDGKFDALFVDLDSGGAKNGFNAPPPEFVQRHVSEGLKSLLDDHGVLIISVRTCDKLFHETLVKELKEVFHKVYEIDVDTEGDCVVIATVSPVSDNLFLEKLESVIPMKYIDSIVGIVKNVNDVGI